MDDLISRQKAIDALMPIYKSASLRNRNVFSTAKKCMATIEELPSAQPTLYGYNIDHLKLIVNVLQKENLPPERVAEALTDIGRIVAIVQDEFEGTLRKVVEQCTI